MNRHSMLTGVAVAALAAPMMTLPAHAASHCGGSYTVQPGDTLAGIAARCNTSVGDLTRANAQIVDPSRIAVGWRLTIPEAGYQASDGIGLSSQTELTPYSDQSGYVSTYDVPPYTGATNAQDYRVQPGDTLAGIATQLGLSLASLMGANSGVNPYGLRVGEVIRVPHGYHPRDRYDHDRYTRHDHDRYTRHDHDRFDENDHDHDRWGADDRDGDHSWRDRDHDRDRYDNDHDGDRYGENHDRDRWDDHDRNDRHDSSWRDHDDHDRYSRDDRDDRSDRWDRRDRDDRDSNRGGWSTGLDTWASN